MTAPAFTQAELALRFRARQARLPRCASCGARRPKGVALCAECGARRHGGIARVVVIKAKKPDTYKTFCAQKRTTAQSARRAVVYQPKSCAWPDCGTQFQPSGPRSRYCEAHR